MPSLTQLWPILLGSILAAAPAAADTLTLSNGDRLSGTVVTMEQGTLTFETDYAEPVKVEQQAVAVVATDAEVIVELSSGERLKGRLIDGEQDGLTVSAGPGRPPITLMWQEVAAINPAPEEPPGWTGELNLGGNLQNGNTDRRSASISFDATREGDESRFDIEFIYNYGEEEGETTARNTYGRLKYDYFMTRRTYTYLGVEMLYDKFKDLALRTVVGPGLGYQVWDTDERFLLFEGGVVYFNEDHIDNPDESWISARLGSEFRYRFANGLRFGDKLTVHPFLEDFGSYQLRNEASLSAPLSGSWSMRLAHLLEYDSDPGPGVEKTDETWTLGLQYQF